METQETRPPIDLAQPVPYEDFAFAVNAVWMTVGRELADRHDWCDAWISYVQALAPGLFPGQEATEQAPPEHPSFPYQRAVPFTPDDKFPAENNAVTLHRVRGRILHFVTEYMIDLGEANEIFAAARLPLYEPPQPGGWQRNGVADADTMPPAWS